MSDYISRDALLDLLDQQTGGHVSGVKKLTLYSVREMIKSIQATKLEPAVHAHWIYDGVCASECSYCGEVLETRGGPITLKHCPECGAHMDEAV